MKIRWYPRDRPVTLKRLSDIGRLIRKLFVSMLSIGIINRY